MAYKSCMITLSTSPFSCLVIFPYARHIPSKYLSFNEGFEALSSLCLEDSPLFTSHSQCQLMSNITLNITYLEGYLPLPDLVMSCYKFLLFSVAFTTIISIYLIKGPQISSLLAIISYTWFKCYSF